MDAPNLLARLNLRSRFPVIHKVGDVSITEIRNHFNFHSKNPDKCKFELILIKLATISDVFP